MEFTSDKTTNYFGNIYKNNTLAYVIQKVLSDAGEKIENFYTDYSTARKNALMFVRRKNTMIEKQAVSENGCITALYEEKAPDLWTNGLDVVKIAVVEMRNN